jgi:uncharacterized protein YqeY
MRGVFACFAVFLCALTTEALVVGTAKPCHRHDIKTRRVLSAPIASLQDDFKARMKAAMKGGPEAKPTLMALRGVVAAMTTKQKESGAEALSDEAALAVLAKLAKMRKESIEMFEKGGKTEAAEAERFELSILEGYLPKQADEQTVRGWIADAVAAACPDGPDKSKMGAVMGKLMAAHKGGECRGLSPLLSSPLLSL